VAAHPQHPHILSLRIAVMGYSPEFSAKFHPEHLADLAKSGLTEEIVREAAIYTVRPGDIRKLAGWCPPGVSSAYAIPYPGVEGFCRVKIFPAIEDKDGHTMKYLQRPGTGCHLYIPARVRPLLADSSVPLILVEGEKKALAALVWGLWALGLGGLWNWLEKGEPLHDLDAVDWRGRPVELPEDSDIWGRPDLLQPVFALGRELERRGARVVVPRLVPIDGRKCGLDDLLVRGGLEAYRALERLPLTHKAFAGARRWHRTWLRRRAEGGPRRGRTEAGGGQTLAEAWPGRIPEAYRGLVLPAGYAVSASGLHSVDGDLITGTAVVPVARIQDLDSELWSYEVLIVGSGAVSELRVPADLLADTRKIVSLAVQGVQVTTINARRLVAFVTACERANRLEVKRETRRLGFVRCDARAAYVLHEVHPKDAGVQYPVETEEARQLKAGLVPRGTLAGVAALVQALAEYSIPLVTLCAALAPAVRELLELEASSFTLYLAAPSSTGKSITQKIALSAWADPENPAWLGHGHVTYAGLEAWCTRVRGLPVIVEDLHLFREEQRGELAMAIGNERFKGRGGERMKGQSAFRGVVIGSGELDFLGEADLAGAGARVLTLAGSPFRGVGKKERAFITDMVVPALRAHHAILGAALVKRLLGLRASAREGLRRDFTGRRDHVARRAGPNAILARQAPQWALLAMTGNLIAETLGLERPDVLEEAVFEEFERAGERPPQDPDRSAFEHALSWARSHEGFFHRRTWEGTSDPGELTAGADPSADLGVGAKDIEARGDRPVYGLINDRKGWVAYRPDGLRKALLEGRFMSMERLLRAWRERGWLRHRKGELGKYVKISGGWEWMYVLVLQRAAVGLEDEI